MEKKMDSLDAAAIDLVKQCEEAVKLLCEKSQHPSDDFDIMAQKLGFAADRVASHCQE